MTYAAVNGQRLFYEDSGGAGPAVLFGHGFLMDHEMWAPQVSALAPEYRCITWDERCWGQTISDGAPFDYWDLADDAIGILDHLGIEAATLVGLSQGGYLCIRAALRHPRRVTAVVLIDTDVHAFSDEAKRGYSALFAEARANGWHDAVASAVAGVLFGPDFDPSYWIGKWRARPADATGLPFDVLMALDDISDRLGEVACPALVIHGEDDAAYPIDAVEAWASRCGNYAGIVRVPRSGHTPPLEQPVAVNGRLQEFLHEIAARR
jgi:3-oxoadipate enol-lactonase